MPKQKPCSKHQQSIGGARLFASVFIENCSIDFCIRLLFSKVGASASRVAGGNHLK
ncbi:hypothetical protein SynROS8604_01031 [Synechococcus sp. ROS8604]|nr:hypothetical protein SynROS8604_01031 [Synechococcus sp. ROS8604]